MNQHLQDTHWIGVTFADFASAAVPADLGTYMIVALPPLADSELRQLRSPLYVGRSNDLRRRMRQHLNGRLRKRLLAFSRLAFVYASAPTPVAAKVREQALISAFGPPLNRIAAGRLILRKPVPAGQPRTTHRSSQ